MSEQKEILTMEDAVNAAEAQAEAAKKEPDAGSYTHVFAAPFSYEGETYEQLTFQWDSLTGKDSMDIERDLRMKGLTVVVAEYTPEYLTSMAARACTYRDSNGKRTVSMFTLQALPLRDFRAICGQARRFLQRAES
ncbi:MAG: hypothetical protein IJ955_02450 [Oscillospiraceae bacterium]|nr:hypothetical protein [Oscillospiraceae bacterium]